jgi:hypothetical protein
MARISLRMCSRKNPHVDGAYIGEKFKTVGFCSNAPAGPTWDNVILYGQYVLDPNLIQI